MIANDLTPERLEAETTTLLASTLMTMSRLESLARRTTDPEIRKTAERQIERYRQIAHLFDALKAVTDSAVSVARGDSPSG